MLLFTLKPWCHQNFAVKREIICFLFFKALSNSVPFDLILISMQNFHVSQRGLQLLGVASQSYGFNIKIKFNESAQSVAAFQCWARFIARRRPFVSYTFLWANPLVSLNFCTILVSVMTMDDFVLNVDAHVTFKALVPVGIIRATCTFVSC